MRHRLTTCRNGYGLIRLSHIWSKRVAGVRSDHRTCPCHHEIFVLQNATLQVAFLVCLPGINRYFTLCWKGWRCRGYGEADLVTSAGLAFLLLTCLSYPCCISVVGGRGRETIILLRISCSCLHHLQCDICRVMNVFAQ